VTAWVVEGGNKLAAVRVWLSKDFKSRKPEFCEAMSKETQRLPARLDWDNLAVALANEKTLATTICPRG